jgi:hypothetical protein
MDDRGNKKYEDSAKVVFYSFIIIGVILLALIVL